MPINIPGAGNIGYGDLGKGLTDFTSNYYAGIDAERAQQMKLQELALKRQQADYEWPQTVPIPGAMANRVMQNPDLTYGTSLENASRIQNQYQRGAVVQDPISKEWFQVVPDPNVKGGVQRIKMPPPGSFMQQSGEKTSSLDQGANRNVAGVTDQNGNPAKLFPTHKEHMQNLANGLNGEYDSEKDMLTVPGRVGMAMYEKMFPQQNSNIADIYKPHGYPPAPYVNPAPTPSGAGRGGSDFAAILNSKNKAVDTARMQLEKAQKTSSDIMADDMAKLQAVKEIPLLQQKLKNAEKDRDTFQGRGRAKPDKTSMNTPQEMKNQSMQDGRYYSPSKQAYYVFKEGKVVDIVPKEVA